MAGAIKEPCFMSCNMVLSILSAFKEVDMLQDKLIGLCRLMPRKEWQVLIGILITNMECCKCGGSAKQQ